MSGFDFVFALFSLVLGLAVAEVLGGFANVMKLHAAARAGRARDVRVGWLVPLLAILVTLNQLSFWIFAFGVRNTLPFSYLTLLFVLVIVGAYYLFSAVVFPDDPEEWPDFDLWYDQNNRFILVGMAAINLVMHVATAAFRPVPKAGAPAPIEAAPGILWVLAGVWLAWILMVVLIFVKRRWLNIALLIAVIALNIAGAVWAAAVGLLPS